MINLELPKPLFLLVTVLLISVIASIALLFFDINILWVVADIALVITLIALIFYVYYTYLLAAEIWTPTASYQFIQQKSDVFSFTFSIKSYSKFSLECWCNLNVKVNGNPVSASGFFANLSPVLLQPHGQLDAYFNMRSILKQVDYTIDKMKEEYDENNIKGQLYFDIEFWYTPTGRQKKVQNPRQPFYFDFKNNVLITDF